MGDTNDDLGDIKMPSKSLSPMMDFGDELHPLVTDSMKTSLSFLRVNSKSIKISESDYYGVLYRVHTYELLNVYQTSADKDSESLDSSVSFLSGRTDR